MNDLIWLGSEALEYYSEVRRFKNSLDCDWFFEESKGSYAYLQDGSIAQCVKDHEFIFNENVKALLWIYSHDAFKKAPKLPNSLEVLNLILINVDCLSIAHLDITLPSLKSLTSLKLNNCHKLKDINALASLTSLTSLELNSCHELKDISALASLKSLTSLRFEGCHELKDVSALASLKSLTSLSLEGCHELKDISAFTSLNSLTSLSLEGCHELKDISALASLKLLTFLSLEGCHELKDISALASLKLLTFLSLVGLHTITDLTSLNHLRRLKLLSLRNARSIKDLRFLSHTFEELYWLDLNGCSSLESLQGLHSQPQLKILDLGSCLRIKQIDLLSLGGNVKYIDVSQCTSLESILNADNLIYINKLKCIEIFYIFTPEHYCIPYSYGLDKKLNLSGCASLKKVPDFEGVSSIEEVDLSGCAHLIDIKALSKSTRLKSLFLNDCISLDDLNQLMPEDKEDLCEDFLDSMHYGRYHRNSDLLDKIKQIELKNTYIRNFQFLSNCVNLKVLDLTDYNFNGYLDLSTLTHLEVLRFPLELHLVELNLTGCTSLTKIENPPITRNLRISGCINLQNKQALLSKELVELEISHFDFNTLSYLNRFKRVESLFISHTELEILPSIALPRLSNMVIYHCPQLRCIDQLRAPNLIDFSCIASPYIEEISFAHFASSLNRIEMFTLEDNVNIQDVSFVASMTTLVYLKLSNISQLTHVKKLDAIKGLRELSLDSCVALKKLERFELNQLDRLSLKHCISLKSFPEIYAPRLRILDLRGTEHLTSIKKISHLTNIQLLNLEGCKRLKRIEPLGSLKKISSLNLSHCQSVKSFHVLSQLIQIQIINLKRCHIVEGASALNSLPNLISIDFSGVQTETDDNQDVCFGKARYVNLDNCNFKETFRGEMFQRAYVIFALQVDSLIFDNVVMQDLIVLRTGRQHYGKPLLIEREKYLTYSRPLDQDPNPSIFINQLIATRLSILDIRNSDTSGKISLDAPALISACFQSCVQLKEIHTKTLPKLRHLNLEHCTSLTNIDFIAHAHELCYLSVRDCQSLEYMSNLNLPSLQLLNFDNLIRIKEISSLRLDNVSYITMAGCEQLTTFTDIYAPNLKELTTFSQEYEYEGDQSPNIPLESIDTLKHSYRLEKLHLHNCIYLTKLTALSELKHLSAIDLSGCGEIHNLDPLKKLPNLKELSYRSPSQVAEVLLSSALLRNDTYLLEKSLEKWAPLISLLQSPMEFFLNLCKAFKLISIIDNEYYQIFYDFTQRAIKLSQIKLHAWRIWTDIAFQYKENQQQKLIMLALKELTEDEHIEERAAGVIGRLGHWGVSPPAWGERVVEDTLNALIHHHKQSLIAPAAAACYARWGQTQNVNIWLEHGSRSSDPIWKDRIYFALIEAMLDIKSPLELMDDLHYIQTPQIKDQALLLLGKALIKDHKLSEAAAQLYQMIDEALKQELALALDENVHIYRRPEIMVKMVIALQKSPEILSKLLIGAIRNNYDEVNTIKKLLLGTETSRLRLLNASPDAIEQLKCALWETSENVSIDLDKLMEKTAWTEFTKRRDLEKSLQEIKSMPTKELSFELQIRGLVNLLKSHGVVSEADENDLIKGLLFT